MKQDIDYLSVVVPVYNEADVLRHFFEILERELNKLNLPKYEIVFVDDGSTDNTPEELAKIAARNDKVKLISLTRNFGKEPALSAGLHVVEGDCALLIDADGQHPPERIKDLLEAYKSGYEMVVGVRTVNADERSLKKIGNKLYYQFLRLTGVSYLQPRVTDFRAISRDAVNTFCKLTERRRITRGLIDWMGYPTKYIEFESPGRLAGNASYSTRKLAILAVDSILSSSRKPLYVSIMLGMLITSLSLLALAFTIVEKYLLGDTYNLHISGTAILSLFILFMVGLIFISQGILALYIARTYEESQQRPLYVVRRRKPNKG